MAMAVAASIEAPGCRRTTVVSLYLQVGVELGIGNRATLAAVAARLEACTAPGEGGKHIGAQGNPFIIRGDFNVDARDMIGVGFTQEVGATMFYPRTKRGASNSGGAGRTIDYFMVSKGLDQGVESIGADREDVA